MRGAQVEHRCNHVIFDDADTRVSVMQRLRIDRQDTASGTFAVAQLRPTSVLIETAGQPPRVVDLERMG